MHTSDLPRTATARGHGELRGLGSENSEDSEISESSENSEKQHRPAREMAFLISRVHRGLHGEWEVCFSSLAERYISIVCSTIVQTREIGLRTLDFASRILYLCSGNRERLFSESSEDSEDSPLTPKH